MGFVTIVTVVESDSGMPLAGVRVSLYDRDKWSSDDLLGSRLTDATGQASFVYSLSDFSDGAGDDMSGWGLPDPRPDLFVVVHGTNGETVVSTRSQAKENVMQPAIRIAIDRQVAIDHGLIRYKPKTSQAEKQRRWAKYWRERRAKGRRPGPDVDLCIGRVVLDMMAGLTAPKNDLQKKLVARLSGEMGPDKLDQIATHAARARKLVDGVIPANGRRCSSDTPPEEMAKLFYSPGGPLAGIKRALGSQAVPDPETTLPAAPAAGKPFTTEVTYNKDCLVRYRGGPPPLDQAARKAMEAFVSQLVAPSVNLVQIWDPVLGNNLREGRPADRTMVVRTLGGREDWVQRTVQMNVPLDDPSCVVLLPAADGRQQLVVDVRPGQKVELRGSGFINAQATLEVFYRPWKTDLNSGRLEPEAAPTGAPANYIGRTVPGFSGTAVRVFGSSEPHDGWSPAAYAEDRIVFAWPESASGEGLYGVRLKFENDRNLTKVPTRVTQRAGDCAVDVDWSPVATQEIWLAVIKPVVFRPVRVTAPSVTCIDETNPENFGPIPYFDDVVATIGATIQRVNLDAAAMAGAGFDASQLGTVISGEVVANAGPKEAEHWFWSAPEVWPLPDPALFPDGATAGLPTLGRFDFMTAVFSASEVEGAADRAVLTMLCIAFVAAVVILLLALIVAAVVVAVGLFVAGFVTAGVTIAILAIVEAVIVAFGAFIVTLLTGFMTAAFAVIAAIPPGDLVANVATVVTGLEIAHRCSPLRFHRMLWLHERPAATSSFPNFSQSLDRFDEQGIREAYTCTSSDLGSVYKMELAINFV